MWWLFALITALIVVLCYVGETFLHLFVLGPLRGAFRSHENLPTIIIESGRTVYCRMRYCDYRFPLPDGAHLVATDPVSGGFDTIQGAIYVADSAGQPLDFQAYAKLLQRHHFNVQPGFTSEADPPWSSPSVKRNHPEGYTIPFAASTRDGGWVAVDTIGGTNKIAFSYFGDY